MYMLRGGISHLPPMVNMSGIMCALLRNKKRGQQGKKTKQNKNQKQMFL